MADESHASCLSSASFASQDVENPCPGTSGGARAAHAPLPRPHRRVCCAPPGTGHPAAPRIDVLLLGDRCDCELVKAYADKGLNECRGSSRPWRGASRIPGVARLPDFRFGVVCAPTGPGAPPGPGPRATRGLDAPDVRKVTQPGGQRDTLARSPSSPTNPQRDRAWRRVPAWPRGNGRSLNALRVVATPVQLGTRESHPPDLGAPRSETSAKS